MTIISGACTVSAGILSLLWMSLMHPVTFSREPLSVKLTRCSLLCAEAGAGDQKEPEDNVQGGECEAEAAGSRHAQCICGELGLATASVLCAVST